MKVQLTMLVEKQPGALDRVLAVFSRRRIAVDHLMVGPSGDEGVVRVTAGFEAPDEGTVRNVARQIEKGIAVLGVAAAGASGVQRELVLLRVSKPNPEDAAEARRIAGAHSAEALDDDGDLVFTLSADTDAVDRFIQAVGEKVEVAVARSGPVEVGRDPPAAGEQGEEVSTVQSQVGEGSSWRPFTTRRIQSHRS